MTAPLVIRRKATLGLWFWHCRICPGFPTVGHASTQPAAVDLALAHARNSGKHHAAARRTRTENPMTDLPIRPAMTMREIRDALDQPQEQP